IADKVGDYLYTLSEDLKLRLPVYYTGENSTGTFINCSKLSTSFSFDLLGIFGLASSEINDILLKDDNKALTAYIIGFAFTVAAITIQALLVIVCSPTRKLGWLFITSTSIGVTVIYSLMTGSIQSLLQPLGAHASLGPQTFTAAWLAVMFSIATLLIWLVESYCCCF
ncbi:hypothetical protein N7536_005768, partial [Penicillium majusculum]